MDETRARERLLEVLELIDGWGRLYERRWGREHPYLEEPSLDEPVRNGVDDVRSRTRLAREVVLAMGEKAAGHGGTRYVRRGPRLSLFSTRQAPVDAPRLRFRDIDDGSRTWSSAHDGAAALVRGAFQGVRNLVAHPGWPEPTEPEALEMLAVLSYVARLVDRCDPML